MSEQTTEDQTPDLPALDPDQFLGDAPAGDAHPGEFMSNDQSGNAAAGGRPGAQEDEQPPEPPAEQSEDEQ